MYRTYASRLANGYVALSPWVIMTAAPVHKPQASYLGLSGAVVVQAMSF